MHRGQHKEDDSRNCWKTARERNRMRARFEIRHRIGAITENDTTTTSSISSSSVAHPLFAQTTKNSTSLELLIREILYNIVQGDRSYFSVQFMAENAALLNSPVSTSVLLESKNNNDSNNTPLQIQQQELFLEQKIQSRWGKDVVEQLYDIARHCESFSFYEYAVWLKRYHVVAALLLGGINPAAAGGGGVVVQTTTTERHQCCYYSSSNKHQAAAVVAVALSKEEKELKQKWRCELLRVGNQALKQFFFAGVPLGLSSYMVKRVVDLRAEAASLLTSAGKGSIMIHNCLLCQRDVPCDFVLCSDSDCKHTFCEVCWWKDLLRRLPLWDDGVDVVQCPVCCSTCTGSSGDNTKSHSQTDELWYLSLEPSARAQVSRQKFYALPIDCKALRRQSQKKAKIPECNIICSCWSAAVLPSLGFNQAVRRDKFFGYVEKGSYYHVKGILVQGIDVGMVNEYGQTALFIAVWNGNARLVQLLLDFGSDPTIQSNGGIAAHSVAAVHGYDTILQLLNQSHYAPHCDYMVSLLDHDFQYTQENRCNVTVLVDPSESHDPAAGSFMVDQALSEQVIEKLIELWHNLPLEEAVKKKKGACSVRSYFCDVLGWLRSQLEECAMDNGCDKIKGGDECKCGAGEKVLVWPHMRFLCYQERSTALAKHIDLCRVHPFRSELRSTHTFILYLSDCNEGGETTLLKDIAGEGRTVALASIKPKRGRLLLFPHECPHQGEPVVNVPKLLLRGEARIC